MEFDPVLVHQWLSQIAARIPNKIALVYGGQRISYSQIDLVTAQLSRALIRRGIKRGDRVVLFMENCAEAVIGIYGILKAGGVFVVAESTSTPSSLRHILDDSGARLLITHRNMGQTVLKALSGGSAECVIVWVGERNPSSNSSMIGFDWHSLLDDATYDIKLPNIIDVDLAALVYTSGSTGRPKGIIATHHNIVSAARSIIQYLGNDESDVILDVLPLAFDYGLYQVIMSFMFGGTVILERSMGYLEPIIKRIESEKVTGFPIVPSISAMFLKMKRVPTERLSSIRYITSTGALWPVEHIRQFRKLLPNVKLFSMYGLTECKRVGFLPPELADIAPESVGSAMPNTEAVVVDDKGEPVKPGEVGELIVRGSNIMQGYWNDREATDRYFGSDRYPADRILHTGDWFRLGKDGLFYFVGRHDDLIKSFGRRVGPREVEDVAISMPGVSEAAALGIPDELNGQVVGLFLMVDKESAINESTVRAHCGKCLESYKVPRHVWFLDALPKTPNGKVDKRLLKEIATKNIQGS